MAKKKTQKTSGPAFGFAIIADALKEVDRHLTWIGQRPLKAATLARVAEARELLKRATHAAAHTASKLGLDPADDEDESKRIVDYIDGRRLTPGEQYITGVAPAEDDEYGPEYSSEYTDPDDR